MRGYRYNFKDDTGAIQASLVLNFETEDAACNLASDLLARSDCATVEVLASHRAVFHVGRDAALAPPGGHAPQH